MPRRRSAGGPALYLRPGSPNWWYDIQVDHVRERKSTRSDNKPLARRVARAAHESLIKRVRLGERPPARMTMDEACARYWVEHAQYLAAAGSLRSTLRKIRDGLGNSTPLDELTNDAIARYFTARKATKTVRGRPPSNQTLRHELNHLCAILERARRVWAIEVGQVDRAEFMDATRPRPRAEVFLTSKQAFALVDAIVPHAQAVIRFALLTGLRRANVTGLNWSEIDLAGRFLTKTVKGGRRVRVELVPEAVTLLQALYPHQRDRAGFVFTYGNPEIDCPCCWCSHEAMAEYRDGRHIQDIKRSFGTAKKKIGIPALRFHDLRHTVASWVLKHGNLKLAQQVLKHRNMASTARYAHLEPGAEGEVMRKALTIKAA